LAVQVGESADVLVIAQGEHAVFSQAVLVLEVLNELWTAKEAVRTLDGLNLINQLLFGLLIDLSLKGIFLSLKVIELTVGVSVVARCGNWLALELLL
jgi:hypothetical protein